MLGAVPDDFFFACSKWEVPRATPPHYYAVDLLCPATWFPSSARILHWLTAFVRLQPVTTRTSFKEILDAEALAGSVPCE